MEHLRHAHAAVLLLVVLDERDERAPDRAAAIERVRRGQSAAAGSADGMP